jgi:hypothetical protein
MANAISICMSNQYFCHFSHILTFWTHTHTKCLFMHNSIIYCILSLEQYIQNIREYRRGDLEMGQGVSQNVISDPRGHLFYYGDDFN